MNKQNNEPVSRNGGKGVSAGGHSARTHDDQHITSTLRFDDNKSAALLFGKFDEHLALIEQLLGVDAATRGNEVSLQGEATSVARAELALRNLYAQISDGQVIGPGDVDGAVRMADLNKTTKDDAASKTSGAEKPDNTARIATHKKVVNARTPMQAEYIRAISSAKLVFGVGPAGTGKTYLAVAHAASLLEKGAIDRIILTRPAVEAG